MTTMIDIMISSVLGGVLLIVALTANDIASENAYIYSGDLYVQQTLTTIDGFPKQLGLPNTTFGTWDLASLKVNR